MTAIMATYQETLLKYYEEEISGEVYFRSLADRSQDMNAKLKLNLLAEIEAHTVKIIEPLISKYNLVSQDHNTLVIEGLKGAQNHSHYDWKNFVNYIKSRFPAYIDDFLALEKMAPTEDLPRLKLLTQHEVVTVEFARMEKEDDKESVSVLRAFLDFDTKP